MDDMEGIEYGIGVRDSIPQDHSQILLKVLSIWRPLRDSLRHDGTELLQSLVAPRVRIRVRVNVRVRGCGYDCGED